MHSTATPVFALDRKRGIVFFNEGCEKLTGWLQEEVWGEVCDYDSSGPEGDLEALTGALAPPPIVYAENRQASVPAYLSAKHGPPQARMIHFFPLANAQRQVVLVLGLVAELQKPAAGHPASPAQELHAELAALRLGLRRKFGQATLIGRSVEMKRVHQQTALAIRTADAVHITGESGTGKEHLARVIHYASEFRTKAFVPLDCARIPAIDLKQTLKQVLSPDEYADSSLSFRRPGTLYLMHVESLRRDLQELLLQALGRENSSRPTELRLISSSTIDIREASDEDCLLPEFYFHLTPMVIRLPALRDRLADFPLLAQHFLEHFNQGTDRQLGGFSDAVLQTFQEYGWPGNLDELSEVIREARDQANSAIIDSGDLPFRLRTGLEAQQVEPEPDQPWVPLEQLLTEVESEQIQRALAAARQNRSKAADLLGMTRAKLYRRMQALGIDDSDSAT